MNRAFVFFMAAVIVAAATASLASSAVQAQITDSSWQANYAITLAPPPRGHLGPLTRADQMILRLDSPEQVQFTCSGVPGTPVPDGVIVWDHDDYIVVREMSADGRFWVYIAQMSAGEDLAVGSGPLRASGNGGRFGAVPSGAKRAVWGCFSDLHAAAADSLKEARARAGESLQEVYLQLEPPVCLEAYALARGHILKWFASWFVVIPRGAGADYDQYGRFECPGVASPTPIASATGGTTATATAGTPAPTPTGGTLVATPTASPTATAGPSPTACVPDPYPGPGTPVSRCPATATATASATPSPTGTTGATNTPTPTATATSTSTSVTATATATTTRTPTPRGGGGRIFLPITLQFKP